MSCSKERDNNLLRQKFSINNTSISNSKKNNSVSPISSKYKKIGNYIIIKTIGSGTFSTVKLGIHLPTKEKVAIKILDKSAIKDENDIKRISREIHILSKLYHPNIAQLYETIWSERHIYIVMEYCEGNHLFNYINSMKRLNEIKASKLFNQLISCLEYIHTLGIVHRDIKPENILLNKNKSKIKLVDFGLSNSYKYGSLLNTACGSPCYAPPEMISGKKYNPLYSDLWSCGIVLYCMLVGKLPFDDEDIKCLYKNIKEGNFIIPKFLSKNAKDLIKKILNCNPNKRIKIDEIKKHPFFLMGKNDKNKIGREGIIIGVENIPVNAELVKYMKKNFYKYDDNIKEKYIYNCIKNNSHNDISVIYYLLKRKFEENKNNKNNRMKIKLMKAENNIRSININNYINNNINNIEYHNKETIFQKKKNLKLSSENNLNADEISKKNKNEKKNINVNNNILNINNIRKLIFNSNDISFKSKIDKDRFNVVVINNILTDNNNANIQHHKYNNVNNTLNYSNDNRRKKLKINYSHNNKKCLSRNERNSYMNNTKSNNYDYNNKNNNSKIKYNKILNLKKINYKFNNIQHIDINKSINNSNINKVKSNKKNNKIKLDNKTNRIDNINLLLDNYKYNTTTTTTKREKRFKKNLTYFNSKKNLRNINNTSITTKRKIYMSNIKKKKKYIDICINQNDLIKEKEKIKSKKKFKYKGVLGSLINNNISSKNKDESKSKSKIKKNNKIYLKIDNEDNNINVINNMKLIKNNSCKNKQKKNININNDNTKKLKYNFSSSNAKKKEIHYISQIRPKFSNNKSSLSPNNSKDKK